MPEIIDGQVVETVSVDLAEYINQKKAQLDSISADIEFLKSRQTAVVAELEALIPQETV